MDNKNEKPLTTPRKKARYGTRVVVGETPLLYVKSGKKEDVITAEEIVEALYEKPVDYIVFKKSPGKLDGHDT